MPLDLFDTLGVDPGQPDDAPAPAPAQGAAAAPSPAPSDQGSPPSQSYAPGMTYGFWTDSAGKTQSGYYKPGSGPGAGQGSGPASVAPPSASADKVPTMTVTAPKATSGIDLFDALGVDPTQPDDAPPPAAKPVPQGVPANLAAGANQAIFTGLGGPVDLATWAMNKGVQGVNAVAGTQIPPIQNPPGGSQSIADLWNRLTGVDPYKVQPTNAIESMAQGAGGALAQVPMMGLGAAGAAPALSGVGRGVADALVAGSGGGAGVQMALPNAARPGALGAAQSFFSPAAQALSASGGMARAGAQAAAGGAVGQGMEDAAPAPLKPYVGMVGNVLGGGAVAGAEQAVRAAPKSMPFMSKQDIGGTPATQAQINQVGGALNQAMGPVGQPMPPQGMGYGYRKGSVYGQEAGDGYRNIQRATDAPQKIEDIKQQLADPALHPLEREQLEGQLQDQQGRRLNLVPNSNPTTGEIAGTGKAQDLEAQTRLTHGPEFVARAQQRNNARVGAIQNEASPDANPATIGEHVAGQLAQMEQAGQTNIASAKAGVEGQSILRAGSPDNPGQIRTALQGAAQPWIRAYRSAWKLVDPDGTWAIKSDPLRDASGALSGQVSESGNNDAQLTKLLARGSALPPVIKFSDLSQMRRDVNEVIANLRPNSQANGTNLHLAGEFKKAIDQTIASSIDEKAAIDPTLPGKLEGMFGAQPAASAPQPRAPSGVPSATNGRAPGRPASAVDWIIANGGIRDPGGDLKAMGADAVHYQQGGRLVNPNGIHPDKVREGLVGEGFLPQDADINSVHDVIANHLSGRPTYRGADMAQAEGVRAGQAAQTQRDRWAEKLYDAKDQVNTWADQNNVRMTKPEQDHAANLVAGGMHPEDAAMSAARETEELAGNTNAQMNAFGSPGVPPAAQQGNLGMGNGASRLAPNVIEENIGNYRAANQATADYKQQFGQGGVGAVLRPGSNQDFNLEEARVAGRIFTGSDTEPAEVQRFIAAVGMDRAEPLARDALVNDLRKRNVIDKVTGQINETKLAQWRAARRGTLDQFPTVDRELGSLQAAQELLTDVTARQTQALKDFQDSVAGKIIGADPRHAVETVLRGANQEANMRQLVDQVRGNPDAVESLKRMFVDYIVDRHSSATPSTDGFDMLKAGGLRDWIAKYKAPLRVLFGGQGMQNLEMVGADLRRQAMPPTAVAGSQTVPHALRMSKAGLVAAHAASPSFLALLGERVAEHFGIPGVGGIVGAGVGIAATVGAGHYFNLMKAAGIKTVNDLTAWAMLHPEQAKALMERADSAALDRANVQRRIGAAFTAATAADLAPRAATAVSQTGPVVGAALGAGVRAVTPAAELPY